MPLDNVYIPYGAYWTTPFCRWQGSLAGYHAIELAGRQTTRFLGTREIDPGIFDSLVFGISVPQRSCFYGGPWLAGLIGAGGITGPTIAQACATSTRMLASAALEVATGQRECVLAVACDRTSNGPHVYYPDPGGPGGTGKAENPVMDSFNADPLTRSAMIVTAENVAREEKISREEQDEVALLRSQQYAQSLEDDRAFQKRYMLPVELKRGRKVVGELEADEGVHPTAAEGLAKLRPMLDGGTVTFGSQTHPADANAGMIVTTKERAAELSRDAAVTVRLLSYGEARVESAMMPRAPVPAAQQALERAGTRMEDLKAIKTHNPFAVNDVYFSRTTGVQVADFNRYGSPLVYGHPQAPMAMRVVEELIEELALAGGGRGLFSGCAAGDTAMALVVEVD